MKFIFSIFFITIVFSLWSNPALVPKKSPDTYGYVNISYDLFDNAASYRPPIYPLFLKFNIALFSSHWEQMAMFFQIIIHSLSTVLVFLIFRRFFSPLISFVLSLCIGVNPSLVFYSTYMLPESVLGFFITLIFYLSCKIMIKNKQDLSIIKKYTIGIGLISGLAVLTKPIWSLGIVPIIFSYYFFHHKQKLTFLFISLALFFHLLLPACWKGLKTNKEVIGKSNYILTIQICMSSLRAGLIDYGVDTPLYLYIEEKKLLDKARNMSGKDDENFRYVYNNLTMESKYDPEFAKAIVAKAPIKLIKAQLSQWRYFFTNRMFSPGESSFPGMPDLVRYLYQGGYNLLYRPFLSILLCLSILLSIMNEKYRKTLFLCFAIILYFSFVATVLSKSQSIFMRYRAPLEYILFFSALFPIGHSFHVICNKLLKNN